MSMKMKGHSSPETAAIRTSRLEAGGITGAAGTRHAAQLLREGGTVAFPTETVYGLGANALDSMAVAKIFSAKGRPAWDPLIVHVDGRVMLETVAIVPRESSDVVEKLMQAFWPGPLTLLLPRAVQVPLAVTAARPLVAVRVPKHPVAQELIRLAGVPIAAPSANRFGHTSPTTAAHVLADLDGRIDAVLDGGPATVGVESTVFDVATHAIYRPGAVTAEMISRAIGAPIQTVRSGKEAETAEFESASPGMTDRHYAPHAQIVLAANQSEFIAEIAKYPPAEVGVMLPDGWNAGHAAAAFRWGPWDNLEVLARLLYLGLRVLDDRGVKLIVCPLPAMGGLGDALRDRLEKAAK